MLLTSGSCRLPRAIALLAIAVVNISSLASARQPATPVRDVPPESARTLTAAPDTVPIRPAARDEQIQQRLQDVLVATGWFTEPGVRVEEGVVFLSGDAESEDLRLWAGEVARKTEGVVAVANRMELAQPSPWDLSPARESLRDMWRGFVGTLPMLVFALVTLALSWGAGILATRAARKLLRTRIRARLLRSVAAHAAGTLVFLVGVYVVLRVSGLTQLALTLVGGTGLVGLALGIAFRDITENFLASVFLSVQRPFESGDLVDVAGVTGYVQQLNLRTTVLMNLDGNLVQIPNATVYKQNLCNFTANANRRTGFDVGIGYDDPIHEAQEIVRKVLAGHPAVLDDPEPSVLVEGLGRATVNLRIYFWLNGHEHSWLKVRSSVIRLVKREFQARGVSMPDEAREVIFPQGVPVRMLTEEARSKDDQPERPRAEPENTSVDCAAVSTKAEAGLYSDAAVIETQAREVSLETGEDLLQDSPASAQK